MTNVSIEILEAAIRGRPLSVEEATDKLKESRRKMENSCAMVKTAIDSLNTELMNTLGFTILEK
jgi:hypothetical protein